MFRKHTLPLFKDLEGAAVGKPLDQIPIKTPEEVIKHMNEILKIEETTPRHPSIMKIDEQLNEMSQLNERLGKFHERILEIYEPGPRIEEMRDIISNYDRIYEDLYIEMVSGSQLPPTTLNKDVERRLKNFEYAVDIVIRRHVVTIDSLKTIGEMNPTIQKRIDESQEIIGGWQECKGKGLVVLVKELCAETAVAYVNYFYGETKATFENIFVKGIGKKVERV